MDELYKNIKKRRIELGMTQDELREKLGYQDRNSISRIERGNADLPISKIRALADILMISVPELLGYGNYDAPDYTSTRTRANEYLRAKYELPREVVAAIKQVRPYEMDLVMDMLACVRRNMWRLEMEERIGRHDWRDDSDDEL